MKEDTILTFFLEVYLVNINKLIIAVENYFGKDYDDRYHQISETFEKFKEFFFIKDKQKLLELEKINRENVSLFNKIIRKLLRENSLTEYVTFKLENDSIDIAILKELRELEELYGNKFFIEEN